MHSFFCVHLIPHQTQRAAGIAILLTKIIIFFILQNVLTLFYRIIFFVKRCKKIWSIQKKVVPLHHQTIKHYSLWQKLELTEN